MNFHEDEQVLPYIGASKQGIILVHTVQKKYEGYTNQKPQKDVMARKAGGIISHPSAQDLEYLVISNNIDYCPIKIHDVKNAHAILGPDLAGVRGKTVRHDPGHVIIDYFSIPRDLLNKKKHVTIVADVMFVKNTRFLVTMYRGIKSIPVEHIPTPHY